MKIYNILWNDDISKAEFGWPTEWVYFEYDSPVYSYKEKDGDTSLEIYACFAGTDDEYDRAKLLRKYLCEYWEGDNIRDFLAEYTFCAVRYSSGHLITCVWE